LFLEVIKSILRCLKK